LIFFAPAGNAVEDFPAIESNPGCHGYAAFETVREFDSLSVLAASMIRRLLRKPGKRKLRSLNRR
jgi:hypothetical protein